MTKQKIKLVANILNELTDYAIFCIMSCNEGNSIFSMMKHSLILSLISSKIQAGLTDAHFRKLSHRTMMTIIYYLNLLLETVM